MSHQCQDNVHRHVFGRKVPSTSTLWLALNLVRHFDLHRRRNSDPMALYLEIQYLIIHAIAEDAPACSILSGQSSPGRERPFRRGLLRWKDAVTPQLLLLCVLALVPCALDGEAPKSGHRTFSSASTFADAGSPRQASTGPKVPFVSNRSRLFGRDCLPSRSVQVASPQLCITELLTPVSC